MRAASVLCNQCPGVSCVRRAQNSQAVIRIHRTVRFARSHQDHALRGISVPRLNRNRADRQRRLVINQRRPTHIRWTQAERAGIRGFPNASVSATNVDRVAGRIRGINRYCRSPPRNPAVILLAESRRIRSQRRRTKRRPNSDGGRCGSGACRIHPQCPLGPQLHLLRVSPVAQRRP